MRIPTKRALSASVVLTVGVIGLMVALFSVSLTQSQQVSAAPPPTTMNFQGRLANSSNILVADGLYNMQFRIFTVASGGSAVWTETRETTNRVQVTNGLFSVQLGSVTPLSASVFNATDLYFEITMATPATATCNTASCASWESPMTPRNKLATSAYAFNAASLNGLSDTDFAKVASNNTFTGTNTVSVDSATALRVQNTSTVAALTADTSNLRIQVGSSTTDSTAVFFLLDQYNQATDPANTINGAMYYNTDSNKFRCYQNGAWTDCIGAGGGGGVNTDLSNLTTTAINQSLIAGTTNTLDIGSSTTTWRSGYFSGSLNTPAIRPLNDGVNAVMIQNALGLSILTVDSINNSLKIGQGDISSISVGTDHTCAIFSDNLAYCWGSDSSGQLGNGATTGNQDAPVAVDTSGALAGKTILSISAGVTHTCAIASDNQAYCWGSDFNGQLGNGASGNATSPVAVDTSGVLSGKTLLSISVGSSHTCALASDDQVYCWGTDSSGQLGNGATTGDQQSPVAVDTSGVFSGKTILSIESGWLHTCAIASDNQAYCWGSNTNGELGKNASGGTEISPFAVYTGGALSGKTVLSISAGGTHTCAIASDNQSYCWGSDTNGRLGNGAGGATPAPIAVDTSGILSGKTILDISAGSYHTCAIASDNQSYCWGRDTDGQLGNGATTGDQQSPVAVDTTGYLEGLTVLSISSGTSTCAIASDNQSYCWGDDTTGELGNGAITGDQVSPYAVDMTGLSIISPVSIDTSGISLGYKAVLSLAGGNTASRPSTPTEGMVYYDTDTKQLLTYANGKWQADRSTATVIVGTSASGGTSSAVASQKPDGADFVNTSDSSAETTINSAITSLPATGGTVYLMEGTYVVDGSILVPSNVTLAGAGEGTVIKVANGVNADLNVIVDATGTGSNEENIVIRDLTLDGNKANNSSGTQYGIYMRSVGSSTKDGLIIEGNRIRDFRTSGVHFNVDVDGAKVTKNIISGNTTHGVYLSATNSDGNTYSHNTLTGNGLGFHVSGTDTVISDNIIQSNTSSGIYGSTNATRLIIKDNDISSNTSYGLDLFSNSSPVIAGNTIRSNGNDGINASINYAQITNNRVESNTGRGIDVAGINNNINSNIVASNTLHGIYVAHNGNSPSTIDGNRISDNGGTGNNNGIYLLWASGSQVTNNVITDTAGTGYAIHLYSTTFGLSDVYLSNNVFSGTGATTILDGGTNTIYANQSKTAGGLDTLFKQADSSSAFQIQNASGVAQLTANTTDSQIALGSSTNLGAAFIRTLADSSTGLQIQNAAGTTTIMTVDSSANTIVIGTGANTITLGANGVVLAGTARGDATISLSPEYAGATFTGDGSNNTGSLSSDFCSGSSRQNINAANCGATETHNYYEWTTTETTVQDYDIFVRYQMPQDYSTGSMSNLEIWGWGTTSAAEIVTVSLISDASATPCSTSGNAVASNATWAQATVASPLGACTPAAGDWVTFKVRVAADENNFARAGAITFDYKRTR